MRYVSVCSGIEAATVAWHALGWQALLFAELAEFPSAVLAHRHPEVPNVGDFTSIQEVGGVDLLVGGTPCQAFSLAGLRGGLGDSRGNLALEFCCLADRLRPRWVLWENVPGVLSSGGGRDFGSILGALALLGYGFAYRVLDAQFFGVPQRRRRVFVVGHLGDWRPAAAVLFERESLRRDPAKGRKARKSPPRSAPVGVGGSVAHTLRAEGFDASEDGTGRGTPVIAFDTTQITSKANRSRPDAGDPCHPLAATAHPPAICFSSKDYGVDAGSISPTLRSGGFLHSHANGGAPPAVVYSVGPDVANTPTGHHGRNSCEDTFLPVWPADKAPTLDASFAKYLGLENQHVHQGAGLFVPGPAMAVRRLTPRECERLQGFPDDYTLIPEASDSARYHALGNSMAVPVMRWLGERIALVSGALA